MEKNNPLLPFAFTTSYADDKVPLNTTPRHRNIIDENASSMYHTRVTPETKPKGPTLKFIPSLKRKMGASFNEKDDIKRRDAEELNSEPTFIDEDDEKEDLYGEDDAISTDSEERYSSGRIIKFPKKTLFNGTLPSSPTIDNHIPSDLDLSTSNFGLPDSPTKNFPKENHEFQHLLLNERQLDNNCTQDNKVTKKKGLMRYQISSEADFGIDQFNRFKSSFNDCPSTDRDFESDDNKFLQKQLQERARQIIIDSFENISTTINLESMELKELPDEIKDLDNLVIFSSDSTQISYQLFLTNNKLRHLPPSLFHFTKLNVLGLRQNKLTRIPASIKSLTNLVDLSLGVNRLEFLPSAILELPNLQIFRAGPNPFMKITDDAIYSTMSTLNPLKTKKCFTPLRWNTDSGKLVPSLKTLCLDKVANYDVSYHETKNWKAYTPKIFHSLIAKAIHQGQYNETCSVCDLIIVEPVAEAFEWWDILQNKNVPIKKEFCSGMCALQWKKSNVEDTTKP